MRLRADAEAEGARLDAFLAGPLGSRARAQRLIEAGAVSVDGAVVPKRHRVSAGETVTVELPPSDAPAPAGTPAPFAVRYEDEHVLVVDKPAGVVVHPARGHASGTLAQALEGGVALNHDTKITAICFADDPEAIRDSVLHHEMALEVLERSSFDVRERALRRRDHVGEICPILRAQAAPAM